MDIQRKRAIRAARIRQGLTQKDVAKLLGIGETSYIHRENGKLEFWVSEVCKLRKILNLTDREILEIFFDRREDQSVGKVADRQNNDYNPYR